MKINFKVLVPEAVKPTYGSDGAAGLDFYVSSIEYLDFNQVKYHTGIAVEIPPGFVGLAFPRSSVFKTGQILTNCVGVIDSDYRGEITAIYKYNVISSAYKVGERCFQLVIVPAPAVQLVQVDQLSDTERGTGGYGSTGR